MMAIRKSVPSPRAEPAHLKLRYGQDKMLQVATTTRDFYVDGQHNVFRSDDQRDLLLCVCASNGTATYEEITSKAFKNAEKDIPKILFNLREALETAGVRVKVLETVRGSGIHLAHGWLVDVGGDGRSASPNHAAMEHLSGVRLAVERSIEHVRQSTLFKNEAGLIYLDDARTRSLAVMNVKQLHESSWQLIHTLCAPMLRPEDESLPDVIEIRTKIVAMLSLVTFSRLDDGISESKWKKDFQTESMKLLSDVERLTLKVIADQSDV